MSETQTEVKMRTITVMTTRGAKKQFQLRDNGVEWAEVKAELHKLGYNLSNMKVFDSVRRATLEHPKALIPEGDITLFIMPTRSKSGVKKVAKKAAKKAVKAAKKAPPKKAAKAVAKKTVKPAVKKAVAKVIDSVVDAKAPDYTPKPDIYAGKSDNELYREMKTFAADLDDIDRSKL